MPLLTETLSFPVFFTPGEYTIQQAKTVRQKAECFNLRRAVFCREQKIFTADDHDEIDKNAILLAASTCMFGHADEVVGTVRIHQPAQGIWWGSRLAVAKQYRRVGGLGPALIKLAVGTAKFHGAEIFLAHVQVQNLRLFQDLDWQILDSKMIHGRPHYLMQADLATYDAMRDTPLRLVPKLKAAS